MKTEDRIREVLANVIREGGEEIERAVHDGPRATLDALDRLVADLSAMADTLALVLVLGVGCGNPDCPNCGQAARDPAPAPSPLN